MSKTWGISLTREWHEVTGDGQQADELTKYFTISETQFADELKAALLAFFDEAVDADEGWLVCINGISPFPIAIVHTQTGSGLAVEWLYPPESFDFSGIGSGDLACALVRVRAVQASLEGVDASKQVHEFHRQFNMIITRHCSTFRFFNAETNQVLGPDGKKMYTNMSGAVHAVERFIWNFRTKRYDRQTEALDTAIANVNATMRRYQSESGYAFQLKRVPPENL